MEPVIWGKKKGVGESKKVRRRQTKERVDALGHRGGGKKILIKEEARMEGELHRALWKAPSSCKLRRSGLVWLLGRRIPSNEAEKVLSARGKTRLMWGGGAKSRGSAALGKTRLKGRLKGGEDL